MNPETKQQLPVVCRVCAEMAAIILWDIVGQPEISSRKEIEMFLDLLKGPKGDPVTQDILNKYLGIGTGCACDNRVFFVSDRRYITAVDLKGKIIRFLESYLKEKFSSESPSEVELADSMCV